MLILQFKCRYLKKLIRLFYYKFLSIRLIIEPFLQERGYLCAAICIELTVSGMFYIARIFILPGLHPNVVLILHCVRSQLTATIALILIFVPKFWYQQKQVRSLAQEYSCRFPVDAFKVRALFL